MRRLSTPTAVTSWIHIFRKKNTDCPEQTALTHIAGTFFTEGHAKPACLEDASGGDTTGAIDGHDPHSLAHSKDLIGLDLLHIGTQAAIVLT